MGVSFKTVQEQGIGRGRGGGKSSFSLNMGARNVGGEEKIEGEGKYLEVGVYGDAS